MKRIYSSFEITHWEYGQFTQAQVKQLAQERGVRLPTKAESAQILVSTLQDADDHKDRHWYWIDEPDHPDWGKIAYLIGPWIDHVRTDIWRSPVLLLIKDRAH